MARLTKEEMDSLKAIGKEINFDFELSPQAKAIMERFDNFPILHFKAWWKKHYGTINGQHLHHYFSVSDGIAEVQK